MSDPKICALRTKCYLYWELCIDLSSMCILHPNNLRINLFNTILMPQILACVHQQTMEVHFDYVVELLSVHVTALVITAV